MANLRILNRTQCANSGPVVRIRRREAKELVEKGLAVWVIKHVLVRRTDDTPVSGLRSRDGRLGRIASLKGVTASFVVGGLTRTETRPAAIKKFSGARVGHQ